MDQNGVPIESKKDDEKDNKKGSKIPPKKEGKVVEDITIKENIIPKNRLATDNIVFIGVPTIRLS